MNSSKTPATLAEEYVERAVTAALAATTSIEKLDGHCLTAFARAVLEYRDAAQPRLFIGVDPAKEGADATCYVLHEGDKFTVLTDGEAIQMMKAKFGAGPFVAPTCCPACENAIRPDHLSGEKCPTCNRRLVFVSGKYKVLEKNGSHD